MVLRKLQTNLNFEFCIFLPLRKKRHPHLSQKKMISNFAGRTVLLPFTLQILYWCIVIFVVKFLDVYSQGIWNVINLFRFLSLSSCCLFLPFHPSFLSLSFSLIWVHDSCDLLHVFHPLNLVLWLWLSRQETQETGRFAKVLWRNRTQQSTFHFCHLRFVLNFSLICAFALVCIVDIFTVLI